MKSDFIGPVNIGSEEIISINDLSIMVMDISGKKLKINNIYGVEFYNKYGFKCPLGVMGRKSDNNLFKNKINWVVSKPLYDGMKKTYEWIDEQIKKNNNNE